MFKLKHYYSIQEALDLIAESARQRFSIDDLVELSRRGTLRMCFWFSGDICDVLQDTSGAFISPPYAFSGYVLIPKAYIDRTDKKLYIHSAPILEAIETNELHNIPNSTPAYERRVAEARSKAAGDSSITPTLPPQMALGSSPNALNGSYSANTFFVISLHEAVIPVSDLFQLVGRPSKASMEKSSTENLDRPLATRERRSLLVVIAALCKRYGVDYADRGTTQAVHKMVELMGAKLGEDTIREILAQIPEALESRVDVTKVQRRG
jgi:hypothetical protein